MPHQYNFQELQLDFYKPHRTKQYMKNLFFPEIKIKKDYYYKILRPLAMKHLES